MSSRKPAARTISASSVLIFVVTVVVLGMPVRGWATAATSCRLTLRWADVSNNESGFKIEQAPSDAGPWTQIAQLLPNSITYRNAGLLPGTAYYYRVRSYNYAGDSDYSNVAGSTTPALGSPAAWAAGLNDSGQATPPGGATGLQAVEAGTSYNLALKTDGTVIGWGLNTSGQATPPAGLTGVVAVAAGGSHSLALKSDGTVVGWGTNANGRATPPAGLNGVIAIAAGGGHSLALKSDGTVVGWGLNTSGQATPPAWLKGVVAIKAGATQSLALRSDGTVVAWGSNGGGLATVPAGLTGVVAIAAGGNHSLALKSDGTVVGWGMNTSGQATPPAGLVGVIDIAAGASHSLALKSDGTVVAWGSNANGQTTLPASLSGAVAISAGGGQTVVLVTNCFFTLSASSTNIAAVTNTGTVVVNAPSGCAWSASSDSDWLHTSSSGAGKGTLNYAVDANPATARSGTITVQDQTLIVNQAGCTAGITVTPSPANGGTVSGGGAVACGSNLTVNAMANAAYSFVDWTEGGVEVSTSPSFTFTANTGRNLVANFLALPVYTISASTSPAGGGLASGSGNFVSGTTVTVLATPFTCNSFVSWTEGGTPVSTAANYSFTASASRALVANFSPITYTINTSATPPAGGIISGGGIKACGATVTVTVTTNAGYSFVSWTENGTPVSATPSYSFTANSDRTLVAKFIPITWTVVPTVTNAVIRDGSTVVVVAGETNVFIAVAQSLSGEPLSYTWDFGDGVSGGPSTYNTASYAYDTNCGPYTVNVIADDGVDSISVPFVASVTCALDVIKLQVKCNFAKTNADSCSFTGNVALPAGYNLAGEKLTVNIAGAQVAFALNKNGSGVSSGNSCRLRYSKKTGLWTTTVKLKKGFWQDQWAAYGLDNANVPKPGAPVSLPVALLLDVESFAADRSLLYLAVQGKSGTAK